MLAGTQAPAQSASNFITPPVAPAAPAEVPTSAAKAAITDPSRFIGPEELEAYSQSVSAIFSMRERDTDPFGRPQDPEAKPIITEKNQSVRRIAPIKAISLSEIVSRLVITTIMPGEKRFLVGTRSYAEGDHIPLMFRGRRISVEITKVSSHEINFRNVETDELASRKMEILPVGMTIGTQGITAPGMVPDLPNAPIDLDADSLIETSQNR